MQKKKINSFSSFVYSTDPNFKLTENNLQEPESLIPANQKLKIVLDKRQRAGKAVTLITGFTGRQADAEELGKKLKTFCGAGGAVKENEIIVQGDNRDRILRWLQNNGYTAAKVF